MFGNICLVYLLILSAQTSSNQLKSSREIDHKTDLNIILHCNFLLFCDFLEAGKLQETVGHLRSSGKGSKVST